MGVILGDMGRLSFLRALAQDPMVASVTPTSTWAARRIVASMQVTQASVIVEYGPGQGEVSDEIVRAMSGSARLYLIERNAAFADQLRLRFLHDGRVRVVHADALEVRDVLRHDDVHEVDVVLSSIPFTFLSPKAARCILEATRDILAPQGRFVMFQFTPKATLLVRKYFKIKRMKLLVRNLPPLLLTVAEKLLAKV